MILYISDYQLRGFGDVPDDGLWTCISVLIRLKIA